MLDPSACEPRLFWGGMLSADFAGSRFSRVPQCSVVRFGGQLI